MSVYSLENGFTKQEHRPLPDWICTEEEEMFVDYVRLLAAYPQPMHASLLRIVGFPWTHPLVADKQQIIDMTKDLTILPLTPFYVYRPPLMLLLENTISPEVQRPRARGSVCFWLDVLLCYHRVATHAWSCPDIRQAEAQAEGRKWRRALVDARDLTLAKLREAADQPQTFAELVGSYVFYMIHLTERFILLLYGLQGQFKEWRAPSHLPPVLSPQQQSALLQETFEFHRHRLQQPDLPPITDSSGSVYGIPLEGLQLLRENLFSY
jgi:hypothetical protein